MLQRTKDSPRSAQAEIAFWPAHRLAAHIRRKKIGCLELLEHHLARVERHNPALNAIVVTDVEGARKRAKAADRALAKGDIWGPLHGVPMTVKESYDVAGLPTTWGSPDYKDSIAARNALAVDRLLGTGAVLFGKTNVPLMLADWQSYNAVYGITNNPWDLSRVPGGSSGGSAAALAAGLSAIEAGSDIGGSIRVPAHYCGVYGHKPTYGLCPPRGHALAGRVAAADISVIGPLARSADDLDIALTAMAGPDHIDGAGYRVALKAPAKPEFRAFRVAVMLDHPGAAVDRAMHDRLQGLVDFLGRKKVKIDAGARPKIDLERARRVYVALLYAAMSGRLPQAQFEQDLKTVRILDPADQSHGAQMARGNTMHHREWLGLNEERHRMRLAWAEFFQDFDLLLCPPAISAAFAHNHEGEPFGRMISVNGRHAPVIDQLFWAGYSGASYLPSTVAPIGLTPEGLPVGVQIIGPQFGDRTCIAFAKLIEREYYDFVPPPGYD